MTKIIRRNYYASKIVIMKGMRKQDVQEDMPRKLSQFVYIKKLDTFAENPVYNLSDILTSSIR